MQNRFAFAFAMQSYPRLRKSRGSFHLISGSHQIRLILYVLFLFSKTFLLGSNTKWLCLMGFPWPEMETRPVSTIRRVLRVSIIIRNLLFCLYFEAVVNVQVVQRSEPAPWSECWASLPCSWWADLPLLLTHCWQLQGLITHYSFLADLALIRAFTLGCGAPGCLHAICFMNVFVICAQHYKFSINKGEKRVK